MKVVLLGLCAGLLALFAMPAVAQDTAAGPMATAGAVLPLPDGAAQPAPLSIEPSAEEDQPPEPADRKVHGFVEVGVGTGGYREAAVAIDAPLPDGGELSVAVRTAQGGGARAPRHLAPPMPD